MGKRKQKKYIDMDIVPCKACKHLKRIPVGYVSCRLVCKIHRGLGIWDCFEKPHPDCPLVKNGSKKSNLSLNWLESNYPEQYEEYLERKESK